MRLLSRFVGGRHLAQGSEGIRKAEVQRGWGGGWSSGAERESEASAGSVRAVIRQILEVVPGGILRAGKTIFGAGSGWWIGRDADGAGKVDIGSESSVSALRRG